MSIVGTRPPLISETNLYEPHHKVRLMPLDEQCVNDTIRNALQKMKENALIEDYKVFTNDGRRKLGLPKHKTLLDEIYLYENNESIKN